MEDALLAVHAVLRHILVGGPPLGGEVIRVSCIEEGVIAGVWQEGLKGEGDNGENTGKEGGHHQDKGDDILAHFPQVDLGDLAGLAGDGGIALSALQAQLVEQHDGHAEDHHNDGQNAGLAGVLGVHGHILGGQGGETQVVGHRVGTHGTAEHQQDGGQNGGLDHGQGDAPHDPPLGGVQNGGRLLQVGVHVPEDAADEDVGKGGVVQSQHHQTGEQPLAPPDRHIDAQGSGQQAVGGAGDSVGVEHILPHHRQGPLGHDVGEDKNRAEVFAPGQVGAGNEEGEQPAEHDGHHAGAHRQQHRVDERHPQVAHGKAAGEKVDVVDEGIAPGLTRQVGVDGARVDLEGILHDGDDGGDGGHRQHDAHNEQDDIMGL